MNTSKTILVLAAGLVAFSGIATAKYPERPIRMVVASAPGGGTDFTARAMNDKFAEFLGTAVVIDNRGGAGGLVGSQIVAEAPADGYTLLQIFTNFAILPSLHKKMTFDVIKDFAPVINLVSSPLILVVNPSLPAKNVPELIKLAQSKQGKFNYAAPGIGSLGHLAGEYFKSAANVQMEQIAYKGGGPSVTALMANQVELYFSTLPAAVSQVTAGRLRALGVTSLKRSGTFPQVPTIAEQGVKDFEVVGWFGMFAPAKTPSAIVTQINAAANKALAVKEVNDRMLASGVEVVGGDAASFAKQVKGDVQKWNKVAEQAGLTK
jgi:tripartite-type tricarboxylate transporter receptor subunit TctC